MEKSSDVPGPTPTPGSNVDPVGAEKEETPSVRSVSGARLRPQGAISGRALGAFTKEVTKKASQTTGPLSFSRRSTVSEVWHKLLELFDRIFANRATELTYQVRDAIVDKDVDALVYLLCWHENTALRDELRQHIEDETDLLEAIQDGQGNQFAVLRMALGIPEQETAPVEPAPAPAPAPAPFDAAAKAQALEVLKNQERVDGKYSKFIRKVGKLNAEQLGKVFKEKPDLLNDILPVKIQPILKDKNVDFHVTILMNIDPKEIAPLLQNNHNHGGKAWALAESILADIEFDQLMKILARIPTYARLIVVQYLAQSPQTRLAGISPDQRKALLNGLNDSNRRAIEALLPFDAAAKAQALEVLKNQERVDGKYSEFVREVSKLNAGQLNAVLQSENSLLIGVLPIEIWQIIQDKDVSFRATLLKHLFSKDLFNFLKANSDGNSWGRMETIFAGMNRDQVVPILAKVSIIEETDVIPNAPCPRLTVIQHLPQNIREQLRGVTPDQRKALLHGWGDDDEHKAQLEALLTQADQ